MTEELKRRIDAELPPGGAPVSLDVDVVMRTSRSRRTRRRLTGIGTVAASVAVITALVLTVLTLAPGGEENGPPDDAAASTTMAADDPVLDPEQEYYWDYDPGQSSRITAASKQFTTAFWKYLAEAHPEASYVTGETEDVEEYEPVTGDPGKTGFFGTQGHALFKGDMIDNLGDPSKKPERRRTTLEIYERMEPGKGFDNTSCCGIYLRFGEDKSNVSSFDIEVYPKGSFTKGTEDRMDPAYLDPDVDNETRTVAGPGGETIQEISYSTPDNKGVTHTFQRAVIVYRTDGTAIAVRVSSNTDRGGSVKDNLDFADLQGIALAMPDKPLP